jgi:dTDP-4-amino-4,6-dideoxygalactose transaminase
LEIPVFKPLIEASEFNAVTEALEIGWLGMGAAVGEFEKQVSDFLGLTDRYAVALSTGHAALHLGLILAGVGPGDEVITPSFNNITDFQAILAVGATPVFCDILESTLCIDVEKASLLITSKTKAIIAMDYDCFLADHEAVQELADQHNLRVIHDAAHSFGSSHKSKKIGTFSDLTMFSFDPVKTITCIDGGMLIVKTEQEVAQLHEMRLVGMSQPAKIMYQNQRTWAYDVHQLGFRYHMSNLHAMVGKSQLSKIEEISNSRQQSCQLYNSLLMDVNQIIIPKTNFYQITPFLYYIRILDDRRQELRDYLKANGVDTGIHWQPGHHFSIFKNSKIGDLTVTERIASQILSLPLHSKMADEDVYFITNLITKFFSKKSH